MCWDCTRSICVAPSETSEGNRGAVRWVCAHREYNPLTLLRLHICTLAVSLDGHALTDNDCDAQEEQHHCKNQPTNSQRFIIWNNKKQKKLKTLCSVCRFTWCNVWSLQSGSKAWDKQQRAREHQKKKGLSNIGIF